VRAIQELTSTDDDDDKKQKIFHKPKISKEGSTVPFVAYQVKGKDDFLMFCEP